jgi:hypothetical protein
MGQFHWFLSDAALQEVHLSGHLYTWSNERTHPTLERKDRVFISNQWDAIFMDCVLHALLLCADSGYHSRKRFDFSSF